MRSALRSPLLKSPIGRRNIWKRSAVNKHIQPVIDHVKPVVYETLTEVYKPLLDKLSSIDKRLEKIEKVVDLYDSKDQVEMVDTETLRE